MVVRAARRGPFVQEWSQLLKRPLPPGAELRGLLQGRRRVEVDLLRRRVVLERLSAINTPVGEVIGRLLEVVPSLSDQYDDVELTEPRVVGMPSGDRYLKANL